MNRRQLFATAIGLVAAPAIIPEAETYYEITISVDHVSNYEDFIRKIDNNHHSGAEAIVRRIRQANKRDQK